MSGKLLESVGAGPPSDKHNDCGPITALSAPISLGDPHQSLPFVHDQITSREGAYSVLNTLGPKVLMLSGTIGPPEALSKVQFMIDSGASCTYISAKLCWQWKKQVIELPKHRVRLPNGQIVNSTRGVELPISIGTFQSTIYARLLDLSGYDVILGFDWLQQWNPQIDWPTQEVRLRDQNDQEHLLYDGVLDADRQSHLEQALEGEQLAAILSPWRSIQRSLRSGRPGGVLWVIRPKVTPGRRPCLGKRIRRARRSRRIPRGGG